MHQLTGGWDLSDLYTGITDSGLERDLSSATEQAQTFAQDYRGKITTALEAKTLLTMIERYESINQLAAKPSIYASLVLAADNTQGAFFQKIRHRQLTITHTLLFFELELMALKEDTLLVLAQHPLLAHYRHWILRRLDFQAHRLAAVQEELVSEKDLIGRGAWVRLFDEELAHKQFSISSGIKQGTYTEAAILHLLYHPHPAVRRAAARGLTQGLLQESRRLTFIFNMIAADRAADDHRRHFTHPQASRHLENEIDEATVQLLCDQVVAHYPLVQDFYRFKKEALGMKELHEYDRYAPVVSVVPKLPVDKAQALVVEAFRAFSPDYARAAQTFFDQQWIDVYPRAKKTGGAFCSYVTPDLHPYVLTNYNETLEDAFVLAHELGHGVHAVLASRQTYLNFDWPLPVAEMASVFSEMLLFDQLKQSLPTRREKFALHMAMVDRIFATVFRQISMYRFEQSFHRAVREQGERSTADINALWRASQVEMYGDAVTLTSDYDLWWSYIPHFIHSPFYVYAYAIGELLTLSLYAKYKQEGAAFTAKYLHLLSQGGSMTPQELLALVDINMHDQQFWKAGLDLVGALMNETKELAPAGTKGEKPGSRGYKD